MGFVVRFGACRVEGLGLTEIGLGVLKGLGFVWGLYS